MLCRATREDIESYMDFTYNLALDLTKTGFPIYAYSNSTKGTFEADMRRNFREDNREVLLYTENGNIAGVIAFFYLEEDKYLQTCAFHIARGMKNALKEFIAYVHEHYSGYDMYFGFPKNNADAVEYFESIGCGCTDDLFVNEMDFSQYRQFPTSEDIVRVTKENYSDFEALHRSKDSEMYWTSERILENFDLWTMYLLYDNGRAVASVYYRNDEIYGVDFENGQYSEDGFVKLITQVLHDLKKSGSDNLIFFCDGEMQDAILKMGFSCVCEYVLYIVK